MLCASCIPTRLFPHFPLTLFPHLFPRRPSQGPGSYASSFEAPASLLVPWVASSEFLAQLSSLFPLTSMAPQVREGGAKGLIIALGPLNPNPPNHNHPPISSLNPNPLNHNHPPPCSWETTPSAAASAQWRRTASVRLALSHTLSPHMAWSSTT